MSVNLSVVQQHFQTADLNQDGRLDRREIANAALNLLESDSTEDQAVGRLFGTFVQGGTDKLGLMPDYNRDGVISGPELALLSSSSGNWGVFEASDFQSAFGTRGQTTGNPIDIARLEQEAGRTSENTPAPGALQNVVLQVFTVLQQMLALLLARR